MSSLVKTIFGGSDDSAQKAQIQSNERAQKFIEEQAGLARGDVLKYIPQGSEAARQGFESAYNLQKQSIPQQLIGMRVGNDRAQETLLGGMGMVNDAIMGRPVDPSGMSVTRLGYGSEDIFANHTPPAFLTTPVQQGQPNQGQPNQQQQIQQILGQLLSGGFR